MGHFKVKDRTCPSCRHELQTHEEKETDVNIALRLLNEAYRDTYDEGFVISRDSDLAPAVRMVVGQFAKKNIKIIAPPALRHSKELAQAAQQRLASINRLHIERSLLPAVLTSRSGRTIATRPTEYDPPPDIVPR